MSQLALLAATILAMPPPSMFADVPNAGGTLYLTWCLRFTPICYDEKQEIWGQICYGRFAQEMADQSYSWLWRYAGWKCPGTVWTEHQRDIGYSDHGNPVHK